MNILMKGFINKNRIKYGLPPIKDIWAQWMGEKVIVACDKELCAAREGVSLFVDEMPFEFLFPRLAAIIYHGGTGTLAAVARAGIPQAAFPFMGDQFANRDQIVKLGLEPSTCDFKKITAESISSAIKKCITNETYKKNATEISKKLQTTDGIEITVHLIEEEFNK